MLDSRTMDPRLNRIPPQQRCACRPACRPARRRGGQTAVRWLASGLLGLGLLVSVLTLVGCQNAQPTEEVDQAEIQGLLESYLPLLGRAYAERNTSLLAGGAVPKEQARIQLRIEELEAQGQIYEPTFQSVTVESVSVWNYSNAYASTVEVWDVAAYTLGSHQLINQSLGQRSRVKYQLKRKEDGWAVLYRELEKTSDS